MHSCCELSTKVSTQVMNSCHACALIVCTNVVSSRRILAVGGYIACSSRLLTSALVLCTHVV